MYWVLSDQQQERYGFINGGDGVVGTQKISSLCCIFVKLINIIIVSLFEKR